MEKPKFNVLGKVTRRKDGVARVTGQEQFSSDIILPRMLHGRIVSSPYAHARIKSVDTSAAEAMGAVCLTFDDIPHVVLQRAHRHHPVGPAQGSLRAGRQGAAHGRGGRRRRGRDRGAGRTRRARASRSSTSRCPSSPIPLEAMQPGAEPLYDTIWHGDKEIQIENNIACERKIEEGDVDQAFAEADVVVEGTFKTPKIYHMQLEPKTAVCQPEPDGGLTVWATTQSIHNVRILLGQIFNIPLSKIDVRRMPVGGTFGSQHPDELAHPHLRGARAQGAAPGQALAHARRGHARSHQVPVAD